LVFELDDTQQRQVEAFIMEFDSDMAPIVGQQVTIGATTSARGANPLAILDLLIQRANTTYYTSPTLGAVKECDLIAKGVLNGKQRGWLYIGNESFQSELQGDATWSKSQLLSAAAQPGVRITFTCVPPGSGRRMGIDRDRDNLLDSSDKPRPPPCSASRLGPSQQGDLATLLLLLIGGLAVRRLRQPRRDDYAV
jgi:hypothetical protein